MKTFVILLIPILFSSCTSYKKLIEQGKEFAKAGEIDKAINSFTKATYKNNSRIQAYYGLGYAYSTKCSSLNLDCQKSIDYFTHVIKLDSNYRHALFNRAYTYMLQGHYDKALQDLNHQSCFEKQDADYCGNRMTCYLILGDTSKAFLQYNKALEFDPSKKSDFLDQLFVDFK
jgi:tetratricopeptide (TPR) repeat protein